MEGSDNAMRMADPGIVSSNSGGNMPVRRFRRQRSLSNKGIHQAIGLALRAHFDDIVKTPMPDTLLALLAELEAKEARQTADGSAAAVASPGREASNGA